MLELAQLLLVIIILGLLLKLVQVIMVIRAELTMVLAKQPIMLAKFQ